jgi:hypothetical protein
MLICDYWGHFPLERWFRLRIRGETLALCDKLAMDSMREKAPPAYGGCLKVIRDTIRAEIKEPGYVWLDGERMTRCIMSEPCQAGELPPWLG